MSDYNSVLCVCVCVTPKATGWSLWMLFSAPVTCDPTIGRVLRASVMICNRKVLHSGTCRPSGLHATGSLSHTPAIKHPPAVGVLRKYVDARGTITGYGHITCNYGRWTVMTGDSVQTEYSILQLGKLVDLHLHLQYWDINLSKYQT